MKPRGQAVRSRQRLDRLVDGQRPAGRLDVQVLHHPAVVGHDARTPGRPPRPRSARGRPRPPARSGRTRRWRPRPGRGGSGSCRRSPSGGPARTRRGSPRCPSRRCRRRRGSRCRRRGAASSAVCRLGRIGARPGHVLGVQLLDQVVGAQDEGARAAPRPARCSSASRIATGVSTIAQSVVWSGAPAFSMASTSCGDLVGAVDLGDHDRVRARPARRPTRSSSCHSVPMPLTRMVTVRRP